MDKFTSNYKLIYQGIYSLLGTHQNAESFARYYGMEFSDLEQIAAMELWRVCQRYRDEGEATFAHYAITCIKHKILSEARRKGHLIRVPDERTGRPEPYQMENLDKPIFEDGQKRMLHEYIPSKADVEEIVIKKLTLEEKLSRLNPSERTLIYMKLLGHSDREIARRLGKTEKAIVTMTQRVLDVLNPARKKQRDLSAEFARLYESGASKEEIMQTLQISPTSYRNYKYRYNKKHGQAS